MPGSSRAQTFLVRDVGPLSNAPPKAARKGLDGLAEQWDHRNTNVVTSPSPSRAVFVHQFPLGPMQNFVYLVGTEGQPGVCVVDPAWDVDAVEAACAAEKKSLAGIFLTHSHKDHINGVTELLRRHDVPVYAQRAEIDFSADLQAFGDALRRLGPGDLVPLGGVAARAVHTPGHTPGSQCLLAGDALVAGDTLFVNGCGRCDFQGGDPTEMFHSLTAVLGKLPGSTRLFPGHDYGDVPVSSLEREAAHNPYFQFTDASSFVKYRMRPRR